MFAQCPGYARAALLSTALLASAGAVPGLDVNRSGAAGAAEPLPILVEHLSPRTTAEVGLTRVVAFRTRVPATEGRDLETGVGDETVLQVVRAASIADGASIGYVRVLGVRPGMTDLTIAGAPIMIEVVAARSAPDGGLITPTIVGPADGAVVWGTIAVGVEIREPVRAPLRRVVVRLPGGREIEPVADSGRDLLPWRHLRYELDAGGYAPGTLRLQPVAIAGDGAETPGPATTVRVIDPGPEAVVGGEAEARYEVERPERFRDARINIGRHDEASGGAFFSNYSSNPAFCFPLAVEEPGWYQVMITAGGTRGQGVLPTIGLVVNGENQSTTNARLLGRGWHRIALGVPIRLGAGNHVLTPYFANDFFVPQREDRNLYLDRIEVARVADEVPTSSTPPTSAPAPATRRLDDPFGLEAVPLRIAFARPLDGQIIPGVIEVEGRAWWLGAESAPAPTVTLFVNGAPALTQRSGAPRFWVDPSRLVPGANRFEMEARLDTGEIMRTPPQTMHWPAAPPEAERPPARMHHRFSVHEERWDPSLRERLGPGHYPRERRSAVFASAGEAVLELPEEMTGAHIVMLEVHGEHFEGPPIAAVALRTDGTEIPVGEVEAPTWWDTRAAGEIDLPAGPKQLVVSFVNDKHEAGRGDRNLRLQSVILARKPEGVDDRAPVAEIRYPADGQEVHLADALVAEASDDMSLRTAELMLDDMPTGLAVGLNLKPGRIVFPLVLRHVEPGEHRLAVRVTDLGGNSTLSAPRRIVVLDEAPDAPGPYRRAVRLLDRFAYGPDQDELAALLTLGEAAWLADRLARGADDPGDLAALGATYPWFVNRGVYEVQQRAVAHAILTPNPVRARFVAWAENHFNTWIRKIQGDRKWEEHVTFARLGPAPFGALLRASAESPAMLGYLDQDTSFAGRLNENYAREIMELHTLGVDGGYTQGDVTNLAGLLTGWTVSLEGDGRGGGEDARAYTFRFDPRLADGGLARVVGMEFPDAPATARYDRVCLAVEMLAAHPSTARFISRKLAEHYVMLEPDDALVNDLARTFLETGGDMRAMLTAIAEHPAFWSDAARDRVASASDYGLRLLRTTRHEQPWRLAEFLRRSGHGPFDRASPDGYPEEDSANADSNAMIQRWRLARDVEWPLLNLVPGAWRSANALPEDVWAQAVIDVIAIRITGDVLGPRSNEAALGLIEQAEGSRNDRARLMGPFVAQLPEANLR